MATKVRHGRRAHKVQYWLTIEGNYTKKDGLAEAGISKIHWNSNRDIKRSAELLAMRTAFVCYFVEQYHKMGHSWKKSFQAIRGYPFRRIQRRAGHMGRPIVVK